MTLCLTKIFQKIVLSIYEEVGEENLIFQLKLVTKPLSDVFDVASDTPAMLNKIFNRKFYSKVGLHRSLLVLINYNRLKVSNL